MSEKNKGELIVRLDKWLWAARFYKTRALAKAMVEGGKVHLNGQRCKASKTVVVGAKITLRQGFDEKIIIVNAIVENRLSAPQAQGLYTETKESIIEREKVSQARALGFLQSPAGATKPDKKQRRKLQEFKDRN